MATKNRLMCYKSSLVLVTNKRITHIFHLSTEEIYHEIDNVIKKVGIISPIEIFKKAIENLLPEYTFGDIRRKMNIYGEEVSIYDTSYYKKFRQYIEQKEEWKEKQEATKRKRMERKIYMDKMLPINVYYKNIIRKERAKSAKK